MDSTPLGIIKVMEKEILSKLHKVMIEIFDEFVRICEVNNFTYLLSGGTLLGAVRHKGFIPWDDDIDVSMPRADYEKFIKVFNSIENSKYYLLQMNKPYYYKYFKLCKKNTIFADPEATDYTGIFIDVWPLDKSFRFLLPLHTFLIKFSRILYRLKTNTYTKDQFIMNRPYIRILFKPISLLFPVKFYESMEKLCLVFNKFNAGYVVDFTTWHVEATTFKMESLFPPAKLLFEGKHYNAPCDYDCCLKTQYGNYMELPPVEKRIAHEPEYIIFDTHDKD